MAGLNHVLVPVHSFGVIDWKRGGDRDLHRFDVLRVVVFTCAFVPPHVNIWPLELSDHMLDAAAVTPGLRMGC